MLSLDQFAWISANLDAGLPKPMVLERAQIHAEAWLKEQADWLALLKARVERNQTELVQRYTTTYMQFRPEADQHARLYRAQQLAIANRPALPAQSPAVPAEEPNRLGPIVDQSAMAAQFVTRRGPEPPPPVAVSFPNPEAPVAAVAPASGLLSLYEYAMLRAEIDVHPTRQEQVYAKYGLLSPAERTQEHEFWKRALAASPEQRAEWEELYRGAERHWRSVRG